jgi:biopolymer transport protein ExbB
MSTAETIKHFFLQTGSGWVLWLLGILSVVSVTLFVERWLFYRSREGDLRGLANQLHERLSRGEIDQAIDDLGRSGAVSAAIAAAGLRLSHLGAAAAEKAMQSAFALERERLQQRLAYLGTLGNNAPFVGLFGTVIGVILAFEELGHGAPGHAGSAAGQVASQAVMTAIAEALVATAVGIAVALPAVAAYNYFQRRVATLLSGSEVLSNLVLAYLSGEPPGPGAPGGGNDERKSESDEPSVSSQLTPRSLSEAL